MRSSKNWPKKFCRLSKNELAALKQLSSGVLSHAGYKALLHAVAGGRDPFVRQRQGCCDSNEHIGMVSPLLVAELGVLGTLGYAGGSSNSPPLTQGYGCSTASQFRSLFALS